MLNCELAVGKDHHEGHGDNKKSHPNQENSPVKTKKDDQEDFEVENFDEEPSNHHDASGRIIAQTNK